jgi:predicted metalloprotease
MSIRRRTWPAATVLLVALLAACSADSAEPEAIEVTVPGPTVTVTVTVEPPVTFEPEEVDEIVEEVIEEEGLADFANLDQVVDPAQAQSATLVLPADARTPETMDEWLSIVTDEIDAYWKETFAAEGLPPPTVFYMWPAEGEQFDTGCQYITDDDAALYCGVSDMIFVSQVFAINLWDGFINTMYGPQQSERLGDFAVAYVLAHEYAHNVQAELGLLGTGYPVWRTELQADCFAGNWANSAYRAGVLEEGDLEEALETANLVGDFEFDSEQHHGTPEERVDAFFLGFDSGDPVDCFVYLED